MKIKILLFLLVASGCTSTRKKKEAEPKPADVLMSHEMRQTEGVAIPKTTISFLWPLTGKLRVVSFFGWRKKTGRRARGERMHEGIDLAGMQGQKIFASSGGRVIEVANVRGYGRTVIVYHGGGWSTLYAHMSKYKARKGSEIEAGEVVGYVGHSGRAEANHLHFEIRKGADPLDPLLFLPSRELEKYAPQFDPGENL